MQSNGDSSPRVYKDGEEFEVYSTDEYDRHHYNVYLKNGKKYWFDNYTMARNFWWKFCKEGIMDRIDVVDPPASKGFK